MDYSHDPNDLTVEMTSNTKPSPNVTSASSIFDTSNPAWHAFDHSSYYTNQWVSIYNPSMPQWLKFDFGSPNAPIVGKYKMVGVASGSAAGVENSPRDWKFQGSNNNTTWTDLDLREDITWAENEVKTFPFTNLTGFRYYRVYVTDYNIFTDYPYLAIPELELFAPPPVYTLTAEAGSYTTTGQAAGLKANRKVPADPGSYSLTGQPVYLGLTKKVAAGAGSYSLTGQAAGLNLARKIAAGAGSYSLEGQLSTLRATRLIPAGEGLYSLEGKDANLVLGRGYRIIAEAGFYGEPYEKIFVTLDGRVYKKMGDKYLRLS